MCGSVCRAVASDIIGPRFESSHRQKFIYTEHLFTVSVGQRHIKIKHYDWTLQVIRQPIRVHYVRKDENKEKRWPGMAHFFLKKVGCQLGSILRITYPQF